MKKKILNTLCPCLMLLILGCSTAKFESRAAEAGNLVNSANSNISQENNTTANVTARDIFDNQATGGIFSSSSANLINSRTLPSDPSGAAQGGSQDKSQGVSRGISQGVSDTGSDAEGTDGDSEGEYSTFAIADVNNYVNVRSLPSTEGKILGKMYDGSVAEILSTEGAGDDMWFQVVSGSVEGYIKAQYFIYGEDAAAVIDDYVTKYAQVKASRLNVRKEPSTEASRIGYLDNGEKVKILETGDEWMKVQYTEDTTGYIAAEYTTIVEEYKYAKSIEEERAELEAQRKAAARAKEAESSKPENTFTPVPAGTNYTSNEELRSSIVEYAMQFLGNKYVSGGRSLTSGTDCSGFTCYIYADFGYSLSRTPEGQWNSNGREITADEIQPGDIVCYSSKGSKCTHVGLYIGDGQIIHSANSRKGVIISNIYYDNTFIGIKNVID